jgi:ABC-type branched-subunit amino acid transport system substrate-binding protein
VIVVVVVVVAAIFAAPLLFPAPRPVIGTVLPVTGDLEIFGPTMRLAVDLAVEEINDAGGVLGQTLTLVHEDSATDSQTGVTAAEKLIDVDGAQAIIGAAASTVSLPILEGVTSPGKVVQISPASTSPAFTDFNADLADEADRFFFRTAPSDALQGVAGALWAYNDKGWRNVAILARADPYGQGLAEVFADSFVALGGTITARVDYDITATVFDTELTTIFASNPEAVWWVAFPGEGELIMQDWWANPAWRGPAWLWSEGTKAQALVDNLLGQGIDVTGMEGTAPVTALAALDNFETFKTSFENANPGEDLVLFEQQNYDAVYLIALAMQAGGSVASQSIRDNLKAVSSPPGTVITPGEWGKALTELAAGNDVNYQGAAGFVNFDEFGDVGSDYEVWKIDETTEQITQIARIAEDDLSLSPPSPALISPSAGAMTLWAPQVGARWD